MKIGIYKITNIINGKMYIGSSIHIEQRWKEHIRDLNKGTHHSIKLQNSWNKHGADNFKFEVVEECDKDRLLYLEQYYIDKFKVYYEGYNCKEKTMNFLTEIDFERYDMYKNYTDEINESIDDNLIRFEDGRTKQRIKYSKYINNEHIWYTDIIIFVNSIFKDKYGYTYIVNTSYSEEEDDKLITFKIEDEILKFSVVLNRADISYEYRFVYNTKERWIIFIHSNEVNKFGIIFEDNISTFFLGKLYDISNLDIDEESEDCNMLLSRYTDKYFKTFIDIINPMSYEPLFKKYFGGNEEMLNEIYKYHDRNKVSLARPCK